MAFRRATTLLAGTDKPPLLHIHFIVKRERRDSMNGRIANGTNRLRNIGVNVVNIRVDFS